MSVFISFCDPGLWIYVFHFFVLCRISRPSLVLLCQLQTTFNSKYFQRQTLSPVEVKVWLLASLHRVAISFSLDSGQIQWIPMVTEFHSRRKYKYHPMNVFSNKSLKLLLNDVSIHFQQILKYMISMKYVQCHMFSVNCHMTRAVYRRIWLHLSSQTKG